MSLDIIAYALEHYTDHVNFERLASEVMREEGYPNIEPLVSSGDKGRDAIEEKLYQCKRKVTTIFQYTLERNVRSKIKKTIKRLEKENIEYAELVLVTSKKIGAKKLDIAANIMNEYEIIVKIQDKETLRNRLSNLKNGIFNRYFPDIERQLDVIKKSSPYLSDENTTDLEDRLLVVASSLSYSDNVDDLKASIIDFHIISILIEKHPDTLSDDKIKAFLQKIFQSNYPENDIIESSISRLHEKKLITNKEDKWLASKEALGTSESATTFIKLKNIPVPIPAPQAP